MTLTMACPNCRTTLAIPKEFEGMTGTCRRCGKPVRAIDTLSDLETLSPKPVEPKGKPGNSSWWFKKKDELLADWIPVDPSTPPVKYSSNKRIVAVRVFTQAGWVIGNLQAPHGSRLVDHLNQQREYLAMLDVFLEGRPKPIESFALQKSAAYFLVASDLEQQDSAFDVGNLREQPISVLLPIGSVYAKTRIVQDVSVAQHFARHTGFVVVTECHYRVRDLWRQTVLDDTEPLVMINATAAIGIAELKVDAPR